MGVYETLFKLADATSSYMGEQGRARSERAGMWWSVQGSNLQPPD